MARSHICIGCGGDLTRLHAPPDPQYRLPVVMCPGCALVCVRRPYAGGAGWRGALRLWKALAGLALRVAAAGVLPAVVTAVSRAIGLGLASALGRDPIWALFSLPPGRHAALRDWFWSEGLWQLPVWLVGCVALGLSFGALFPHWRLRWWPVGVVVVSAGGVLLPAAVYVPVEWCSTGGSVWALARDVQPDWGGLRHCWWPWLLGLGLAWSLMPAGQRAAIHHATGHGLASRRLRNARKRRRMQ